jgi:hypothetical protein
MYGYPSFVQDEGRQRKSSDGVGSCFIPNGIHYRLSLTKILCSLGRKSFLQATRYAQAIQGPHESGERNSRLHACAMELSSETDFKGSRGSALSAGRFGFPQAAVVRSGAAVAQRD